MLEGCGPERQLDGGSQRAGRTGLQQQPDYASLVDGAGGRFDRCMSGKEDSTAGRKLAGDYGQEFRARHSGHEFVGDNDIKPLAPTHMQRNLRRSRRVDAVRIVTKGSSDAFDDLGFVVDEQYLGHELPIADGVVKDIFRATLVDVHSSSPRGSGGAGE
jgi:hypothetical protein